MLRVPALAVLSGCSRQVCQCSDLHLRHGAAHREICLLLNLALENNRSQSRVRSAGRSDYNRLCIMYAEMQGTFGYLAEIHPQVKRHVNKKQSA